jgi:hypothetical protein
MRTQRLLLSTVIFLIATLCPSSSWGQDEQIGDEQRRSLAPNIQFAARVMQSAQFIQADNGAFVPANEDATFGFHRVRFNLELAIELHERINAFVDLGHEPNDFGAEFAPAIDFVALDLALTPSLTLRLGTPVTGLFNFRGYSDGAAVQDNPLIGNSPADMVTAETGVQLLGTFAPLTFDLTWTSPTFLEDFGPERGFTLIGKAALDATEAFRVGAGYALGTNGGQVGERSFDAIQRMGLVLGDGENYNFPGSGVSARDTHAGVIPGLDVNIVHVDAEAHLQPALIRAWYGYAWDQYSFGRPDGFGAPMPTVASQASSFIETESQMDFVGATLKVDVSPRVYLASRGVLVTNRSNWAADDAQLFRIQAGVGVRVWERALLKLEFVSQNEQANSPGQIGADWRGVAAEFSVGF